jgi:glycosyltransferase involved in cell wall biosynthesis
MTLSIPETKRLQGASTGCAAPRVSIVVPAYNRERFLSATLDSALAQTFRDWELVVFDDGSTDATFDIAVSYANRDVRIRAERGPNGGVAAARNRGYAATDPRSEFVIFLDSDDVWDTGALETLVDQLELHPSYSSAHCVARCIDTAGRQPDGDGLETWMRYRTELRAGQITQLDPDEPTTFAAVVRENWIVTPGTHLIRRKVLDMVGEFDAATDPADDWDMAIRISRVGDIGFVDRPLLSWRQHPNSLTAVSPRWRRAHFRVRSKTLTDRTNTPSQATAARLAYVGGCRASWWAARRGARDRQYRHAAKQCAVAFYQSLQYLKAEVALRVR